MSGIDPAALGPTTKPSSRLVTRPARQQEAWVENLTATAQWSREHGRTPSFREPHGAWLRRQRAADCDGTLSEERRALLDEHLGEWRQAATGRRPDEDAWNLSLSQVCATRDLKGRLPTSREPGGRWLRTQRNRMAAGTLPACRIQLLDERTPGWRTPGQRRR